MVQHLAALLVALIELLEAEAERLKLGLRGFLTTVALLVMGAAVGGAALIAGMGFLLWSLYLALLHSVSAAWAALIVGVVVWLAIGGAAWLVARKMKTS